MVKSRIITLCLCLFFQFQYAEVCWAVQGRERGSLNAIDQNKAIAIANRHARRTYKSLKRFRIIPCEGVVLWRIIYDGGGPEYVIDKGTGMIIKVEHLPQGLPNRRETAGVNQGNAISENEAINIAREDARVHYGNREDVNEYDIKPCEQARVWRIVFDFKPPPGARGRDFQVPYGSYPQYVIDKASGRILYRARD